MTKRLILVPLDGSEVSRQILPEIIKFISPAANELVLLQVAHAPTGHVGRPSRPVSAELFMPAFDSARDLEYNAHPLYASQEWERLSAMVEDGLQNEARPLRAMGFAVQTAIQFGNPAEKIVEFIEAHHIDLVAMTTHGRSGLSRLVLGSVAEHILRSAPVPVMMLRAVERPAGEVAEAHLLVELLAGGSAQ